MFVRKEGHGLNMVSEELFFPGSLRSLLCELMEIVHPFLIL
jgi:hypothetical protein